MKLESWFSNPANIIEVVREFFDPDPPTPRHPTLEAFFRVGDLGVFLRSLVEEDLDDPPR